jgi:hypothetical protein
MSADFLNGHLDSPQSLNRYSYVVNDPVNLLDPLGLDYCQWDDGSRDDSPEDGGDTFGQCADGKGTWIVESTVTVNAGPNCPALSTCVEGDPSSINNEPLKLTPALSEAQCDAVRILLAREEKGGTTSAAWQSAIGFGDGTVEPFNSSTPGNAYVQTAAGTVKVDWFTDLRLSSLIPGPQAPAYVLGKLVWTGERLLTGAPVTNFVPFQDPVETHTFNLAIQGYGFRNLFTPQFMHDNCDVQ